MVRDAAQALFPSTRWSRVLLAQRDPARVREVLEELVRPRWKALYVLARQRLAPMDAEDAVQSFLARLVSAPPEEAFVRRLDPEQGSLRAYLKAAFARHLINLRASELAQKRGGGARAQALHDIEEQLSSGALTPEQLFERAWAASLFGETLLALEAEFTSGARRGPFELVQQVLAFGNTESYEVLATRYGMSLPQLKAFIHRTKRRFRSLLEERVTRTLAEGDDVETEIGQLLESLAS
jgi:DNA-directed RNA polymerase specialized sigma24 family protein